MILTAISTGMTVRLALLLLIVAIAIIANTSITKNDKTGSTKKR